MFISISGGNYFSSEEMVYVISYNSEFARAVYKTAKAEGRLANLTKGKPTKSVILLKCGVLVACPLKATTIMNRLSGTRPVEKTAENAPVYFPDPDEIDYENY
ncbi:MAG: DUF370 domain-containing protein [Ruminococcus sp.]|nr:DUF370 domain-containing protein [Ruminococcus sp.]